VVNHADLAARFRTRAAAWQLRTRRLELPALPLLMGVVNVTPDSFSDGGKFFDQAAAIDHGLALAAAGADVLDVGGESTRPYAEPVAVAEELRRVLPVVSALAQRTAVPISIDTSKAEVAIEALAAGAEVVNDVTALESDPRMIDVARSQAAGVCAMHMLGDPRTMQDDPRYDDVVNDVFDFLRKRRDALLTAGIAVERIALDPGIGFGKTHQHNLTLLANAHCFHALGCPLVFGPSRKGYIGKVLGDKTADRTAGTVGVALALAAQGVQIIRVHDIRPVREALLLFKATGGIATQ
jgi:dihydropteroate synthase